MRAAALLLAAFLFVLPAQGQRLTVEAAFAKQGVIDRDTPITLLFSRPLTPGDGRLAVFIGHTDATSLFTLSHTTLRYDPDLMRLPTGETEVTVYLVQSGNTWHELARFPLRVRLRGAFDEASMKPSATLTNEGQVALAEFPEPTEPDPRATYQDLTGQLNLAGQIAHSGWTVQAQANAVGVTYEEKALRFFDKGEDAPRVDLSTYLVQAQRDGMQLHVGHIAHGQHRLLINSFSSRGAMVRVEPGATLDASVALMNGARIVGWSNPLGLDDPDHRIVSGTIGLNLLPDQPGQFRLEASYLNGSKLPRNAFNQGAVLDAERSQGLGLRLLASTADRRFQLEGGLAGSSFTNPNDPALAPNAELVSVREDRGLAHYLDVSMGILPSLRLGGPHTASLQAAFRRERIDPAYQTVAAFLRPDVLQNTVEIQGTLSALNTRYAHTRSQDNLDAISSILTTNTHQHDVNLGLTPQTWVPRARAAVQALLPRLGYAYNHTHQFGVGEPVNGGFNAGHIPDQVSRVHNADATWQHRRWRLGYRFSHAVQDNRQEGREDADFANRSQSVSLGVSPASFVELGVDVNLDRSENLAAERIDRTRRLGFRTRLQPVSSLSLSAAYSPTRTADQADLSRRVNTTLSLETAYRFTLLQDTGRPVRGQAFVRYTRQTATTVDRTFEIDTETRFWTVNTGLSISL